MRLLACLLLLCLSCPAPSAEPQTGLRLSTEVPSRKVPTRPGRPKPARGSFDLAFDFYDGPDPDKDRLIGSESQFAVPLRKGRFAITIPMPPSLRRQPEIWLNIQAAPGGTGHYVNLSRRNLPVKTARQHRVSSRLRISGTILNRKGQLVLGPYETVWLLPQSKERVVQKPMKKTTPAAPPPPASVLERIRRDLGQQPGQFQATARLDTLWPLEAFPVYGGIQLLELLEPASGKAVEKPPENLLFMLEIPDRDAVALEALIHREGGFDLQLAFSDLNGRRQWLTIRLQAARLEEVHRLGEDLYSLRLDPGQLSLEYKTASTRPVHSGSTRH